MKRTYKRTFTMIAAVLVLILLFFKRLTGVPIHIIIGLIFCVILGIHTWRRRKRIFKCPRAYSVTDIVILAAMFCVLLSGFLLKPLHGITAVLLLHKVSALVFAIGLLVHMVQHMSKHKKSRSHKEGNYTFTKRFAEAYNK